MPVETKEAPSQVEDELRDVRVIETRPADLSDLSVSVDILTDNPHADAKALAQKEARRKALMKTCFAMTSPSQWVIFESVDKKTGEKKATVYPMGGAADGIIRHILSCRWDEKTVEVDCDAQGEPLRARAAAWLLLSTGQRYERFEGAREMGGFIKNRADLVKGALENMKSVAVRDLLGLRGRSPEELSALGLNLAKVGRATFQDHKQGAGVAAIFPWGNLKGKPLTDPEVKDKDLNWLVERLDENIDDQSKAKYRDSNVRLRDACFAEIDRRAAGKASGSAPSNEAPKQDPGDEPGANG
jgi:hypothetical protein